MSSDNFKTPEKAIRNEAMVHLKKSGVDPMELKEMGLLNEVVNAMIDFKFPKRRKYNFKKKKG